MAIEGYDVIVSASIGIAVANAGGMSADNFLKCADIAMYGAKAKGPGNYRMFDPEMDAIVQARSALERDIRNGILHNHFRVFYQPLVNLRTREVSCFEALLRWQHPERGLVSPSEFIPLAEETGLIVRLGEWVMREACAEAMCWPDDISVSVNLSAIQFAKGDLVSTVMNALASSGLPASRLELEITESCLLERTDHNIRISSINCMSLGFELCLTISVPAIPASATCAASSSTSSRSISLSSRICSRTRRVLAIVRAIVGLGSSFGITTTAEGVETEDQRRCLNHEGCDEVQGFLYSAPLPPDELPPLLGRIGAHRLAE